MRFVDLDTLLPEDIPAGEPVLWHGRPDWTSLARRAFRIQFVLAYFGLVAIWAVIDSNMEGSGTTILGALMRAGLQCLCAVALLAVLAWLSARTTLYVITSKRLVMKIGIALPVFFNLPFTSIAAADLRSFGDGTGDISFSLNSGNRIGYIHLWPHARPFSIRDPQPALRCIPNARKVAERLAQAMRAACGGSAQEAPATSAYETPGLVPTGTVTA